MLKVSQWFGRAGKYLRDMTKSHAAMRYIVWYRDLRYDLCRRMAL